jgi:hypothetical protein
MAIYFVGQYPELLGKLSNEMLLQENVNSLTTSMAEVEAEMNGVSVLLTELEGKYKGDLAQSFSALTGEIAVTYTTCVTNLQNAIQNMTSLSGNLEKFKTNDEDLEKQKVILSDEEKAGDGIPKTETVTKYITFSDTSERREIQETRVNPEYIEWERRVEELRDLIKILVKTIKEYREKCDGNIASLDEFNESIIEIRLKMAAIAFVQDGLTLEEIAALTPEEREKLIGDIIKSMTEKYNEYKAEYKKYMEMLSSPENYAKLNNITSIYNLFTGSNLMIRDNEQGMFDIIDFITKMDQTKVGPGMGFPEGRTFNECIEEYLKTGSLNESGLAFFLIQSDYALVDIYESTGTVSEDDLQLILQNRINDHNLYSDIGNEIDISKYTQDLKDIKEICKGFQDNYDKAVEVGVAIKGMQELKGHVRYDAYYLKEEYVNYQQNKTSNAEFLDSLYYDDDNPVDTERLMYMSSEEMKMYRYLYENEGRDAAETFADSINTTLNRREGYVKATEAYYTYMDGTNEGLEAVWDHISMGAVGAGDGLSEFCDGLVDLVAPSKELTAEEYSKVALLGYLNNGGTDYDSSLLTSYNVGNAVGKETIPTLVSLVNPTAGKTLRTLSSSGNKIEDYFRADDCNSYFEALAHAGADLATNEGIDAVANTFGLNSTPVGKLLVAGAKNVAQNSKEFLFGNNDSVIYSQGTLIKEAKGQIAGEISNKTCTWFKSYLKTCGWSDGAIETASAMLKPVAKQTAQAGVDAAYTYTETIAGNVVNGTNNDARQAAEEKFESTMIKGAEKIATGEIQIIAN